MAREGDVGKSLLKRGFFTKQAVNSERGRKSLLAAVWIDCAH